MGAEGVKMATQIEVDGGPLLREQAQASPPPPLWLATAAEKTAHKQISDAHRATEVEEAAVRSMAEHSRNGAGGSRATVAESGNIVEMPCRPERSATLDAHNIGMSIPVGNSLEKRVHIGLFHDKNVSFSKEHSKWMYKNNQHFQNSYHNNYNIGSIFWMVLHNKCADDKFAQEFGINVNSDLVTVPASVLPPPLKMINGGTIDNWTCLNFSRMRSDEVQRLDLTHMCNATGMSKDDNELVLPHSMVYGKALEVARKGNYNFDTCDIVMKCLQKAERKVDEQMQKQKEQPNVSMNGTSEKEMHAWRIIPHLILKLFLGIDMVHLDRVQE
ncbi:unnamed protein product [Miscanthus lutarioriparius]|uniref:Uncharacterized protein n=1 Tax=Miscanthus lutarioriparius TaxID=422564 RepID=A0A811PEH6_9POAL|nr:unnamed protein product [Miscanthus lutarioriparius]